MNADAEALETIEVDGRAIPLRRRHSARAKRLALRVAPGEALIELVVPHGVGATAAARFVDENRNWIARRHAEIPVRVPFADGLDLEVFGEPLRVVHDHGAPARPRWQPPALVIGGHRDDLGLRVGRWLKRHARAHLDRRARGLAETIGARVAGIQVRDSKTRWGSCSAKGELSFSWRLALAPLDVSNYVVAHEVAHLEVLDHSAGFWRLVARLEPDYRPAQHWLRRHGPTLHRYG